jgi:hypothetical protein
MAARSGRPARPGSYHYQTYPDGVGRAFDAYGSWWRMVLFMRAVRKHHGAHLTEGIFNPGHWWRGLSVKNGRRVDHSFWGSETWNAHKSHVHLAV